MRNELIIVSLARFMSVTRGWWMAWSSSEPRRSGAFVVEIIEKAPQNKLKEFTEQIKGQIDNIKEKIGRPSIYTKDVDNVLRPGDMFRLRSVKFPDFELGITSVKLKDEFCYLGLRKVSFASLSFELTISFVLQISAGQNEASDENDWCMGVRFSVKAHTLSNELFKI